LSEKDESAVPYADQMIADIEALEHEIPVEDFQKKRGDLASLMKVLENLYHKREKKIDTIMTYGTGYETREALRMVPTPVLEKWATELSTRKVK